MPRVQWTTRTISPALASTSAITSRISPDDALLQAHVGRGVLPDRLQIARQRREVVQGRRWHRRRVSDMPFDPRVDLGDTFESAVPAKLRLRRPQPVLGIGRIVLPKGPVRRITGRLQGAPHRLEHVVTPAHLVPVRLQGGFDRPGFDGAKNLFADGVVHAEPAEGDAAWLAMSSHPRLQAYRRTS